MAQPWTSRRPRPSRRASSRPPIATTCFARLATSCRRPSSTACSTNADGRMHFTYLSQRVVEVLGLPAEALFAEPTVMLDVMVEGDRQRFLTAMERALTETMTLDVVVRVRRFDGELRWCHIRSATRNIEGHRQVCEGVVLDVTDQKRVEDQLVESQTRNQAILSALPDLMFVMSRDGVYLDYHARDMSTLLLPPEQFIGRHMNDVLPADLAAAVRAEAARGLRVGRDGRRRVLARHAGRPLPLRGAHRPLRTGPRAGDHPRHLREQARAARSAAQSAGARARLAHDHARRDRGLAGARAEPAARGDPEQRAGGRAPDRHRTRDAAGHAARSSATSRRTASARVR